jgi:hypothetical protein
VRFLDDQGRLFGKINIIDLGLILLLAALLVLVPYRLLTRTPQSAAPAQTVEVTLLVEAVRPEVAQAVTRTRTIYLGHGRLPLEVTSAEVVPRRFNALTATGETRLGQDLVTTNVLLRARGPGYLTPPNVTVGGERIGIGARVVVRSLIQVDALVLDLREA